MDRASFECIIMNSNIENNSVLISSSKSDDEVDADIDLDKGNGILNEEHLESIDTKLKREDCVEFKYWVKCIPYHRNSIRRIYNRINQTMHEEYLCHHECENLCKEEAFFYDYMPRIITQREWNLLQDENSWWNDELINFSYTWFSRYADRDKSSFLFLPSFWSAYTESETVGAITAKLNQYLNRRNTTIQSKTMIALPHNVGENHWRLFLLTNPLYVKSEDKSNLAQIFLFDSCMKPGYQNETWEELPLFGFDCVSVIAQVIKNICYDGNDLYDCQSYRTITIMKVAEQPNGDDCGVHVVYNLKELMKIHDKMISGYYDGNNDYCASENCNWEDINDIVKNSSSDFVRINRSIGLLRQGYYKLFDTLYDEQRNSVKHWLDDISNKKM